MAEQLTTAMESLREAVVTGESPSHDDMAELESAAQQREEAGQKLLSEAQALRQIINGIRVLQGVPEAEPVAVAVGPSTAPTPTRFYGGGEPPRGIEAVRQIMGDGKTRSASDIFALMEENGWLAPDLKQPKKAVETAIHRLFQRDELERVGRGRYRATPLLTEKTRSAEL